VFEAWKIKRGMRKVKLETTKMVRKAKAGGESLDGLRAFFGLALGDRHSISVRVSGAVGLGEISDPRDVERLVRAMTGDSTYIVSAEAATALGKIGGEEALTALVVVKDASETDPRVKVAAMKAYARVLRAETARLKTEVERMKREP